MGPHRREASNMPIQDRRNCSPPDFFSLHAGNEEIVEREKDRRLSGYANAGSGIRTYASSHSGRCADM